MDDVKLRDPRGEMKDDDATVALIDHPDSTEEIPTLDFAPYLEGRPGGKEEVAARLREITMTVGFFYLKNHGVPQHLIDGAFAESKRFHSLSDEEKYKLAYSDEFGIGTGYRGAGRKNEYSNTALVTKTKPSLYSQFSVRREPDLARATKDTLGEGDTINVWPELPGFRQNVLAYHAAVETLARKFLPLWGIGLGLPEDHFVKWFKKPHFQLGLLHYPPQKEVGNRQYGINPHTDNAMMTFLAQQDVPGLAVRMPSGHWRAVDIVPGTLLVNTGNVLVQWTNEDYLSTKHRVINTNEVDRYSIPIFFGPDDETLVEVLPTCQGPGRPPLYEPITYRDLRNWYFGKAKS